MRKSKILILINLKQENENLKRDIRELRERNQTQAMEIQKSRYVFVYLVEFLMIVHIIILENG